jgi:hypothetical protein
MSDLAVFGDAPVSKYGPQDDLQGSFTKGKTFLPRVEFKSGSANIVKAKKFPCDHYALVSGKDQLLDLGENFPAMVLSYRYKAIDFREKDKVKVSYDPHSAEFKAIQAEADRDRPPGVMSGAMYGAEFLLAVKQIDGQVVLATLLCGSASWKMVAKGLFGMVRRYCSFGSKLVEGRFTYMAPVVSTFGGSFPLDIHGLSASITEFANASGTAEEATDTEEAASDRVR